MTARDRRALNTYIRYVADEMGLRDWTFTIRHGLGDEENDGTIARCQPVDGRRHATITFCSDFREHKLADQRNTVVHELIHCHLTLVQWQVERDLKGHLAPAAFTAFFDSFVRNVEHATDSLAGAVEAAVVVPKWPRPPKRKAAAKS